MIDMPGSMELGDAVWWRGMRFFVTDMDEERGIFRYAGVGNQYRCASNMEDARFLPHLNIWAMTGVEGTLPTLVDGKIVDPEPPRCANCGAITWRAVLCTNCSMPGGE